MREYGSKYLLFHVYFFKGLQLLGLMDSDNFPNINIGKFFFNVQISASERSVFNLSKIEPRPLFWWILTPSEARIPIKHHHRSASFHGYERINLLTTHSTRMAAGNLRFSPSFLEEAKHIDSRIPVSLFAGFPLEEHAEPWWIAERKPSQRKFLVWIRGAWFNLAEVENGSFRSTLKKNFPILYGSGVLKSRHPACPG